jgi:Rod binding domain-containing protein
MNIQPYQSTILNTASSETAKLSQSDPAADADNKAKDAKLRQATQGIETLFVSMLLKTMHKSAAENGLFPENQESSTYRDMFDDAVAKQIGKTGDFGISDMLYREFTAKDKGNIQ